MTFSLQNIPPYFTYIQRLNDPSMARTKQTARKSTPGKALKQNMITAKAARKSVTSSQSARKSVKRYRPGSQLLIREIKKYSKSVECLIKKRPFKRFVHHSMNNIGMKEHVRFKHGTLDALQEALENFIVSLAEDAYLCTRHANRVTLMPRDLNLVMKIKRPQFICGPLKG